MAYPPDPLVIEEDECADCHHGSSMHWMKNGHEGCDVPGCDCDEFVQPEYEDG